MPQVAHIIAAGSKLKKKLQMKAWEKNIGARICESKYLT